MYSRDASAVVIITWVGHQDGLSAANNGDDNI